MEPFYMVFFLLILIGGFFLIYCSTLILKKTQGLVAGWRYLAFYVIHKSFFANQ